MTLNCSVSRTDLIEGLNSLQNITNKRVTLAILSNILIESTNNRESGSDTITIKETENSWVVISAGLSTYNLAGMASDEFPEFPEFEEDNFVSFEAGIITDIIDKVIFSVANEEENAYSLTNVLFETEKKDNRSYIRMISSDGHRLSIMEKDVAVDVDLLNVGQGTLIPKKGVQELKKFCDNRDSVDLSFEEKQLVAKDDESVMVIRLKKGEFPQYRAIVDAVQLDRKIQIERIPFLDSLKRINIFTEDIFHTIQLEIENGKMILSSQNVDLGNAKDIQDVQYDGESLKLGFNCRYFIEALQVMECDSVDAYINSNNSPCLIKSDVDEGFLAIVMPMQL
jgi:DNA polymerase-3 subunit beta